jgi:hypothetical protein
MKWCHLSQLCRNAFKIQLLAICMALLSTATFAATVNSPVGVPPKVVKKYAAFLMADDAGQEGIETARLKIMKLSKTEVGEFVEASRTWLAASDQTRRRAVMTFEILRKHQAFDKDLASAMLKELNSSSNRPHEPTDMFDSMPIIEKRLFIFLAAKMGQLTADRIARELKFVSDAKQNSAERLGIANALVDAMDEKRGEKPTAIQLETLLKNDVPEIRVLAVDWFQISPPADPSDRNRFFALAFKTNPRQVLESAIRACDSDATQNVREKCSKLKPKSGAP